MFDDANSVMVVRDPETCHVLPGGRREAGETVEQTLRRELLEETGHHARYISPQPIGFLCHKHLTPYNEEFPGHLYPFFFNIVYLVKAGAYDESALEIDGYETIVGFMEPAKARQMGIRSTCGLFLAHAETLL